MRFSNALSCLVVFAMLVFGANAANAELYTFNVDLKGGPDFSFNLDKTPTPIFRTRHWHSAC